MLANYAEIMSYGVGFQKVEIQKNGSTTTVYSGKTSLTDVSEKTEELDCWKIRRNIIVDDDTKQTVTETWAEGSWKNRDRLTYKYKQR